ncbi:protein-disulfide reductase DsbD family protein [Mucilaginibacter paludis]|uniref:Cytochrome c biogenesis protein transmembrane region n=1 Tax=Mucilaginibacter paludis DSM 18603 TaxID=714943 RepID=H1Y3G8_9SPHI|nr:thioredoxin family protein [Mucilaginibacter paludis]EHQ29736.1 cytochrome c biogenesis protein transmembrane region [Mucilaginibacter paludis DSM 18603]
MKTVILILFCFFLSYDHGYAQVVSGISVKSNKWSKNVVEVEIRGEINKGWIVYSQDNQSIGLNGLKMEVNNAEIEFGSPKQRCTPVIINDDLFNNVPLAVFKGHFAFSQLLHFKGSIPGRLNILLSGFASKGQKFLPITDTLNLVIDADNKSSHVVLDITSLEISKPLSNCGIGKSESHYSILAIFLLGFAGGLLGLLTPCVFPMIPLTVSWFSGQSVNKASGIKNGMLYGIFIISIYLLGSLPFHLISGLKPELLNSLSTNVWVNLFFFGVFVFFALSFFGLFEITVSGKLTNKADSKSDLGSIAGIFFMALTLALVSFSCTGPILGSLLVGSLSSSSGAWALTAGMGGFGLALALPFTLFAMFPSWMKALPKSGGWLAVFKKSLAFVEVGLAFKFLSNADLVDHWGILPREVFIGIWLLIAMLLAAYLLGAFERSANLNGRKKIGYGRIASGGIVLMFAIYLGAGLFNKSSLELLSGFPPPTSYSLFKHNKTHEGGIKPDVMNDYQAALALSKKTGKPLMLDFTGWACVNCRKMEENVWTKPEVAAYIRSHFVLISLYVDDRKELPLDQQFMYGKKEIKSVGDLYATMESVNFKQVTQPLYVLLSKDEKLLNTPVGYTPDTGEYLKWLQCGFEASRK